MAQRLCKKTCPAQILTERERFPAFSIVLFWKAGSRLQQNLSRKDGRTLAPIIKRRGWDLNPRWTCAHNGFRDRPIQPLSHLSKILPCLINFFLPNTGSQRNIDFG